MISSLFLLGGAMNGFVFYGLIDFYENKETILEIYKKMTIEEIEIYKLWVYALPWLDDDTKDNMWEYLNGSIESCLILKGKYERMKKKNEKRRQYEIHYTDEVE